MTRRQFFIKSAQAAAISVGALQSLAGLKIPTVPSELDIGALCSRVYSLARMRSNVQSFDIITNMETANEFKSALARYRWKEKRREGRMAVR